MITALPAPRPVFDVPELRWGVLGTGWIADQFVGSLQRNTEQRVVAVGSRTQAGADRFAAAAGIERAHASYQELVADPEVDVVYIATPHPSHCADALLAIEAGKHVLIEKPIGVNAEQARQIGEAAQAAGVFAMEAMWTLFLPKFDVIAQLLADGVFGQITSVQADIGEWFDPAHRIYDPVLAGGCMLDLATYPVTFATWVAGEASSVAAVGDRAGADGADGADGAVVATTSMVLRTDAGVESILQATTEAELPTTACIAGSDASLTIDRHFYRPGPFTLTVRGGTQLHWDEPRIDHDALFHQALHLAQCVGEGRTQSPVRPMADCAAYLRTMDRVRELTGDPTRLA